MESFERHALRRFQFVDGASTSSSRGHQDWRNHTKIYVGNLHFDTNNDHLREAFAVHGSVISAEVVMDRDAGVSRGFGFVEMSDGTDAERAIAALNQSSLDGRVIAVNVAKPREERRTPPRSR